MDRQNAAETFDQVVLEVAPVEFDIALDDDLNGGINTCIRRIRSKIVGIAWDDIPSGSETRTELGHIEAWLFLGGLAMCLGRDIVDDADAGDADSYDAAAFLYGDGSPLEDALSFNALYLHHIYIRPGYRGRGLARRAIAAAVVLHDISSLGGVLLCVNSQYQLPSDDPFTTSSRKDGDRKLATLYRSMGFKPTRNARKLPLMYASTDALGPKLGLWGQRNKRVRTRIA